MSLQETDTVVVSKKRTTLHLSFAYDEAKIKMLKWIGARWISKSQTWSVPDNHLFRDCLDAIFPGWRRQKKNRSGHNGAEVKSFLMAHQKRAVQKALHHPRFCFFYGCGTGKTLIGIEIHRLISRKTLVVCPRSLINNAWLDDIKKFAPTTVFLDAHKTRKRKNFVSLLSKAEVVVINFESFRSIAPALSKQNFETLIVDESSKIKSHSTKITKALTSFADNIERVYLLSGTPAPNSEMEYFSQMRVITPKIFGSSFVKFKSLWFTQVDRMGYKHVLNPRLREQFFQRISKYSDVITKQDALDLPDQTFIDRCFELNKAECKAYKEMTAALVVMLEDKTVTTQSKLTQTMKLRQISAGSIIDEDKNVNKIGSSKLLTLKALLQELGSEQAIIWTQFSFEAQEILQMVSDPKAGLNKSAAFCNGLVTHKAQDQAIADFKSGSIQFLIAHPLTIAHGVTLTNCTYSIDFSLSYSYESWEQKNNRIHRKGQSRPCTYYTLKARYNGLSTIDDVVYNAVINKNRVETSAFEHIKKCASQDLDK